MEHSGVAKRHASGNKHGPFNSLFSQGKQGLKAQMPSVGRLDPSLSFQSLVEQNRKPFASL